MSAHAAVGIDDDLAAGQPRVAHGTTHHEAAGGIDEVLGLARHQSRGQHRLDDFFHHHLAQGLVLHTFAVLGGNDDGVDGDRLVLFVVANGDLALAVGTEEIHDALLAHVRQPLGQLVRQHDGRRHQLGRLVAGVAEHHALIARALLVVGVHAVAIHSLRDVRRLALDRDQHAAGLPVEPHGRVLIADALDHVAHDGRKLDLGGGGDLAGHHDKAGLGQGLAGHPAGLVFGNDGIEHAVRHLVAQLVRMAFGHTFGREQVLRHTACLQLSVSGCNWSVSQPIPNPSTEIVHTPRCPVPAWTGRCETGDDTLAHFGDNRPRFFKQGRTRCAVVSPAG